MATYETLDDLKAGIERVREEGRRIIRLYNRFEQEYANWEDQVNELEQAIQEARDIAGLNKEEFQEKLDEPNLSVFDD